MLVGGMDQGIDYWFISPGYLNKISQILFGRGKERNCFGKSFTSPLLGHLYTLSRNPSLSTDTDSRSSTNTFPNVCVCTLSPENFVSSLMPFLKTLWSVPFLQWAKTFQDRHLYASSREFLPSALLSPFRTDVSIYALLLDQFTPLLIHFRHVHLCTFWSFTDAFPDTSINAFLILHWYVCRHVHIRTFDPSLIRFQTCLSTQLWSFAGPFLDMSIYALLILPWGTSAHSC